MAVDPPDGAGRGAPGPAAASRAADRGTRGRSGDGRPRGRSRRAAFALLRKDLRILGRSPLLVALLVLYPIVVSTLVGVALSRGPERPKIAFLNEVPAGESGFSVGGQTLDAGTYANRLFSSVDPVRVRSRAEAERLVREGDVLGALIVPADTTARLRSALNLAGGGRLPTLEVVYNASDPVKSRLVESTIKARVADANAALGRELTKVSSGYIRLLLDGGNVGFLNVNVLGLKRTEQIVGRAVQEAPAGSRQRAELEQVQRFARLAVQNLDVSDQILGSISQPIRVKQTSLQASGVALDTYAVAAAATLSLMLVTVLLGAGLLAMEREEHTLRRLVRGLIGPGWLTAEKVVLAGLCGAVVTLLLGLGIGAIIGLDLSRVPLWLPAAGLGGLAFGALGVALGALAKEVRAASLLAILLALPVAFLALVPDGAVSPGLYDASRYASAIFPFRPALQAISAAFEDGSLLVPLVHLLVLTLAWGTVARLALRREA